MSEYLEHHGILGQKWGVRRFESANGHLTAAGKARYNTDENGDYQKSGAGVQKAKKHSRKEIKKAGNAEYDKVYDKLYEKHDDPDWVHEKAKAAQQQVESKLKAENKALNKERNKKLIIAGAAVAGTALAAYGGYKLHQLNQQNKATSQAIDNATKALNEFKAAQNSMNRPSPLKPTSSSGSQNAASHTTIDRVQVDRTPIDRIQIDRFEPDRFGFEKFSAAADMNDSFVQDLLKKNSSKLKDY